MYWAAESERSPQLDPVAEKMAIPRAPGELHGHLVEVILFGSPRTPGRCSPLTERARATDNGKSGSDERRLESPAQHAVHFEPPHDTEVNTERVRRCNECLAEFCSLADGLDEHPPCGPGAGVVAVGLPAVSSISRLGVGRSHVDDDRGERKDRHDEFVS